MVIGGIAGYLGGDGVRAKGSEYRKAADTLKNLQDNVSKALSNPRGYKQQIHRAIKRFGIVTVKTMKSTTKTFIGTTIGTTVVGRFRNYAIAGVY